MTGSYGHVPALDGVRGLALLIVVLCHTNPQVFPGGNIGVDLFFVLSGFLITSILLSEHNATGRVDLRRFYYRRALRLLPALFLLVAIIVLHAAFTESGAKLTRSLWDAVSVAFYYWNWRLWWSGDGFPIHQVDFTHLWSLSIEEQFYMLWPALLILLLAQPRKALLIAAIPLIAWPAIGRMLLWESGPSYPLYFRSDLRVDSLMFGALAAYLLTQHLVALETMKRLAWPGFAGLILFLIAARFNLLSNGVLYMGGYTVILALGALIIVVAATYPPPPMKWFFEQAWLRWTGKISYGLYLWHIPAFHFALKHFPDNLLLQNGVALLATLAISAASFYLIERPCLALKDKLPASRPASVSPNPREESAQGSHSLRSSIRSTV